MPLDLENSMNFTPVTTGDMSDIPADLPEGEWMATCKVTNKPTSKDSFPMLILQFTAVEDLDGSNADKVGMSASDFITFFPEQHAGAKMGKLRVKSLCEGFKIDLPDTTTLAEGTWDSLAPFVEELEGQQWHLWTTVYADKKTGEKRTQIHYSEPGKALKPAAPEEEETEEAPEPEPEKPAAAKKTAVSGKNGKKK